MSECNSSNFFSCYYILFIKDFLFQKFCLIFFGAGNFYNVCLLPSFSKTHLNNLVKIQGLKPINNFSFLGDSLLIIFLFLKKTDLMF